MSIWGSLSIAWVLYSDEEHSPKMCTSLLETRPLVPTTDLTPHGWAEVCFCNHGPSVVQLCTGDTHEESSSGSWMPLEAMWPLPKALALGSEAGQDAECLLSGPVHDLGSCKTGMVA